MQINRRGFLKTGTIAPAAALAGCGGDDDGDSSAEMSGFATVSGQKLYYVTLGAGTPVIFMHGGLGFDHEYFGPLSTRWPTAPRSSTTISWARASRTVRQASTI